MRRIGEPSACRLDRHDRVAPVTRQPAGAALDGPSTGRGRGRGRVGRRTTRCSALVHSDARARSNKRMHSRITAQYTMPEVIGPTSPLGHRHHDVVESRGAGNRVAHGDECLPMAQRAEGAEVGVVETVTDLASLVPPWRGRRPRRRRRARPGARGSAGSPTAAQSKPAASMTLSVRLSQPPAWAICPRSSRDSASQNAQRARFRGFVGLHVLPMRRFPRGRAVVVVADHVRGDREPFEVDRIQLLRGSGREAVVRLRPRRAARECVAAALQPIGHVESLARAPMNPKRYLPAS